MLVVHRGEREINLLDNISKHALRVLHTVPASQASCGEQLLNDPILNKGTAFTAEERTVFALHGKLPPAIETLEQQVERAYLQYQMQSSNSQKNIFLHELHATNRILFYKLVVTYLAEILPILYTPEVANTVTNFSLNFRRPHGLYVTYPERARLAEMLSAYEVDAIDLIVVTDGERVLGIGDQGIGAIHIPIAKLMLYTIIAGVNPSRVLPVVLDVGTNNQALLNDPLYFGWRHPRLRGTGYDEFIDHFVSTVKARFPKIFLHWEDFGRDNAAPILARYRDKICSFNDDLQGTAVVTVAALLAALKVTGQNWREQRIVIFGAGTSGVGIAEQIIKAMQYAGMTEQEAHSKLWLIDKQGLLLANTPALTPTQQPFAHNQEEIKNWQLSLNANNVSNINNVKDANLITLSDVVKNLQPTILLGCSAQSGAFTKEIIRDIAQHVLRPIIFPLSNPTSKCEAIPQDIIEWTDGRAIVATGSLFSPVNYQHRTIPITQCNNALAFPGIGMGVIASKVQQLTDEMLWAACQALLATSPVLKIKQPPSWLDVTDVLLLPPLAEAASVALQVACAVMLQARQEQLGAVNADVVVDADIPKFINEQIWLPKYLDIINSNFS